MPPAGIPPKRVLPSKESALFRELLNLYETRGLKKAVKTADAILKKFPEHGGRYTLSVSPSILIPHAEFQRRYA